MTDMDSNNEHKDYIKHCRQTTTQVHNMICLPEKSAYVNVIINQFREFQINYF